MKKRLSSYLVRKRNAIIVDYWDRTKDLSMAELGRMMSLSTQQIYSILKEAREAKEKEFHDHLTYKANPDFKK